MEALNRLVKRQNVCLICTLHQPTYDVLSRTDCLYVLTKSGHNLFWGQTSHLQQLMSEHGFDCSDTMTSMEKLLRLSIIEDEDYRLNAMRIRVKEDVQFSIASYNDLDNQTIKIKTHKRIILKDIFTLFQRELKNFICLNYR